MQVRLEQLARHLAGALAPAYLVAGDEPLLVQEACDDIIAAARERGFGEREVSNVDAGADWTALLADTASLSLFAERRLLDVRATGGAFDRSASAALKDYLGAPAADVLLLVRTGRLQPQQRRSAWFQAFEAGGAVVLVWPVDSSQLPRWLSSRCARAGLTLDREALAEMSERVEGNLLAAVQEIEKLKLLDLQQPVTAEALRGAVQDASHFDAFDVIDAALAGQATRVRRILAVLRLEGAQPLAVHGAFLSQVRQLIQGSNRRLPPARQRALADAAARLPRDELEVLIRDAAIVDQRVKGFADGDPWRGLETLLLRLAGARVDTP